MGFLATRPILRSLIVVVLYYFKNSIFFLQKLERSYNILGKLTSGLSERETNDVLNAHVGIVQKQEEQIDFYMQFRLPDNSLKKI